jgi:hypothetical protein
MEEENPQQTEDDADGLDRDDGYAEQPESEIIDQGQGRVVDQRVPLVRDPLSEKDLVPGVVAVDPLVKIDPGARRKIKQDVGGIGLDVLRPKHGGDDQDQGQTNPLFPGHGRSGSPGQVFHYSLAME